MIILGSQQDGVYMSDQGGLCSVGQKALGEDVSAMLGAILTLPFELHFCRAGDDFWRAAESVEIDDRRY